MGQGASDRDAALRLEACQLHRLAGLLIASGKCFQALSGARNLADVDLGLRQRALPLVHGRLVVLSLGECDELAEAFYPFEDASYIDVMRSHAPEAEQLVLHALALDAKLV